jgi:hypothetical protein
MDEAIERESSALRHPSATERVLAERLGELSRKEERLLDLAEDGLLPKVKLAERLSAIGAQRRTVQDELGRARHAAEHLQEMERTKHALVAAFGTGLSLGITWMPPALRREIYQALGLRITVGKQGGLWADARVDEAAIRFSREVERYAGAIREAEEQIAGAPPEPNAQRLDRIERELARVRRELSSPTATDTVMAEVAS